jgi:hypothetical protein
MKAMLREGENIYHSHMKNVPKFTKIINIKILKKLAKETIHQYMILSPPLAMRGKTFKDSRPKNCQKSCNFTTSNAKMPPI